MTSSSRCHCVYSHHRRKNAMQACGGGLVGDNKGHTTSQMMTFSAIFATTRRWWDFFQVLMMIKSSRAGVQRTWLISWSGSVGLSGRAYCKKDLQDYRMRDFHPGKRHICRSGDHLGESQKKELCKKAVSSIRSSHCHPGGGAP